MKKKKIIITGVESTGKTTLARRLALHFNEPWVPEYARTFLAELNRPYNETDLLDIAQGQLDSEVAALHTANDFILCDTDTTVIKIWSLYKYGRCHPHLETLHQAHRGYLYFIPYHDVPYEADPLRENRNDRHVLFDLYIKELDSMRVNYYVLKGRIEERFQNAISMINSHLRIGV